MVGIRFVGGFHSMSTFLLQFQCVLFFSFWIFRIFVFFASNPSDPRYRNHQYDMDCITWSPAGRILQVELWMPHVSHVTPGKGQHNYQTWKKTYVSNIKTKDTCKITPARQMWQVSSAKLKNYIFIAGWWFVMGWVSGLWISDEQPVIGTTAMSVVFPQVEYAMEAVKQGTPVLGHSEAPGCSHFCLKIFVQKTNSHHCGKSWWPNQDVIPSLKLTWHSTWLK